MVLLPASLYIPVVQDWVCQGIVSLLNGLSDDCEYEVGSVRLTFPLQIDVNDVTMRRRVDGHTLLHVGRIQTGLDEIPRQRSSYMVNELRVSDVTLGMDSLTESLAVLGSLRQLDVKSVEIDLDNSCLNVGEVVADQPDLAVYLGPSAPDTTESSDSWTLGIGRVIVRQGKVGLDMSETSLSDAMKAVTASPYLDYNHLQLTGIDLAAEQIAYDQSLIKGTVNLLCAREENCGLEVKQVAAAFAMNGDRIAVNDLDIQLAADDYLRGDAVLDLTMADEQPKGLVDVKISAAIDSANLVRLVAPYVPQLRENWVVNTQSRLELDGRMTADSLDLRNLSLSVPGFLACEAEGSAIHVLDNANRIASITLDGDLWQTEPLLSALVAEAGTRDFCIPDSLHLSLGATQQGARVIAKVDMLQQGNHVLCADAKYDVETESYQIGALTHGMNVSDYMPSVVADGMCMQVQAEGRHFDLTRRSTRLDATLQVDSIYFNSIDGRRDSLLAFSAQASMIDGNYMAEITSNHPTLRLESHVEGCYRRDTVSADGYLNISRANMAFLPYLEPNPDMGILSMRSRFAAGYNWAENAHAHLIVDTLAYDESNYHRYYDIMEVRFDSYKDRMVVDVTGGDALIGVSTDCSIVELPVVADSLMAELNRQTSSYRPDIAALFDKLPKMDVEVRMARKNPFSQTLEYQTGITFDRMRLTLHNDRNLKLNGLLHNYQDESGGMSFDTIAIGVQPSDLARAYDYRLHAQHHELRETNSYNLHAHGSLMPDSITMAMTYVDGRQKTVYDLMASLALGNDTMTLHLEDGPTLYEQPFSVNPDNYIRLSQYLDLEHEKPATRARLLLDGPRGLKMHLYTRKMPKSDVGNQLLFTVRNLDLDYAHRVMEWEGETAGTLNVTTSVDIFPDSINARVRSGVKQLRMGDFATDTVALNLTAQMAPQRRDLTGTLALDSIVKVQLDATLADSTDIDAKIDELPLPLLSAFLPKNMQLRGSASGNFKLLGKDFDHAVINGGLAMNEAGMTYTDLNANFTFPNDTIRFSRNRLLIRDYKILAANQNPINVRGLIDMSKDIANPAISLTVTGDNVRLINSKKLEIRDQYLCGRLPVSPNIKIRGTASKLDVTGRVSVLSGTDLQFYMQDDPLESSSKVDQLVEFVRFDHVDRMLGARRRLSRQVQNNVEEGLNVDLTINIANDAKMVAHLAGTDNNKVNIVGGAGLTLQCGNDGKMLMNGSFDISSGKVDYKLPILPMVKTFSIDNSSNLTWQGSDPANPVINITAVEEVKTAVNDDAGARVVRFLVSINISGTLDALQLTFDCTAPDDGSISSDIASLDAEERSKAALMLLIAQTYIGPGNSSSMGLGTANAALNSMLNREMDSMLAGMKHTSIDVGIDTYNADGGNTRTNYSLKVSQNFFNDRFRATIGGQVSSGTGQTSGARLGDMSLEWLIKKDGSHLLKLFRTTNYESVLEGELIETGISYVQERSGFGWRQLFIPNSVKRQQRIQEMIKQLQEKEAQAEREERMRKMRASSATMQPNDTTDNRTPSLRDSVQHNDSIPHNENIPQ